MSAFSDSLGATAQSLIQEFGEACTFTRCAESDYDPNTASSILSCSLEFTSFCVPEVFTVKEIDGTSIKRGDVKLLVGPILTDEIPSIDDLVEFSSLTYRIINVEKTIVNAATVLFTLQVRE